MILADTSLWVRHFRVGHAGFQQHLAENSIVVHPAVIGELATVNLRQRESTLSMLLTLRHAKTATFEECLSTIETNRLFSRGLGWVDVQLLVSARLSHLRLWTLDRTLHEVAEDAGVAWQDD